MTCERPKVQLYLYLDGELAPSEAAEVEQHLQTCEDCQGDATVHHRMQALLHTSLPLDDAAAERLWTAIEAQLPQPGPEPSTPQRRRPRGTYVWSGMAAAAAMVLLAVTL